MGKTSPFAAVVTKSRIVVCVGTGGVGKTTTAAAIGLAAAEAGRRCVVVTVDPARRLAQALGLAELGNDPTSIAGVGRNGGSLDAAMLDPRATFDTMVTNSARDDAQRERILTNRFYQNLAGNLAGTQEYMAMEKLHELSNSGLYDLVVVDTPPTRDALAFLDAPRVFARLLDNWLYKLLVTPSRGLARTAAVGAHTLVRQLTKVVGNAAVDDALAFFRSLDGIEEGFSKRATAIYASLQSSETAFVLVVAPRPDALADAEHFAAALDAANMAPRAVVINRLTPTFGTTDIGTSRSGAARALADFRALAEREATEIDQFISQRPDALVVRVPMFASDVHDLDGLSAMAAALFSPDGFSPS